MPTSQVLAAKLDDLGAQAVSKDLGGLPVVADPSVAPGTVRVVLGNDYTGPGSGLDGTDPTLATADPAATESTDGRSAAVADHHRRLGQSRLRDHGRDDRRQPSAPLLDPLMKRDPVGPRITYYDDATGERIELSTVTLANWAAKTANLLRDELGAGPGQPGRGAAARPLADRRGAARRLVHRCRGRARARLETDPADVALCTADRFAEAEAAVGPGEIAVLSLDPFGKPVPDLPVGVTDYATSVRVHGDQIVPERDPGPGAGRSVGGRTPRRRYRFRCRAGFHRRRPGAVDGAWDTADELTDNLLAVFVAGGSLVQVANPDPAALDRRRQTEKITKG